MMNMKRMLFCFLLTTLSSPILADDSARPHEPRRVPWTPSGVHGPPEPPLPYRVERAFPNLTFNQPLEAAAIPGADRIVAIELAGKILSFPNDDKVEKTDLFADLTQFDPEVN